MDERPSAREAGGRVKYPRPCRMLPRWYIESVSRCWPAEVVASTYQQMFYAALGSSEVGL